MTAAAQERLTIGAVRARVGRRVLVVRMLLLLERTWRAFWPAAALIGAYAAFALMGVLRALPAAAAGTLYVGTLLMAALLLARRLSRIRLPTEQEARRRLEADNGTAHRPIDALYDSPVLTSGATLWRRHRERAAMAADRLRPAPPRLSLVTDDPRALRALVLLGLFIGLLRAGPDAVPRLRDAFAAPFASSATLVIDAWIAPPDYTGRPSILIPVSADQAGNGARVLVPAGSALGARVSGSGRLAFLRNGSEFARADGKDRDSAALEARIETDGTYALKAGGRRYVLPPFEVIPDTPPVAGFARTPQATERWSLRIDYTLHDDYGVVAARMEIAEPGADAPAIVLPLAGAETRGEPRELREYRDLTAHPLAGSPVEARIVAEDAIGQTGMGERIRFVLPERIFTHPVAKRLVAFRKGLFRSPAAMPGRADELDEISRDLASYGGDLTVFAALRSAYWRLSGTEAGAPMEDIAELLWRTALRLEEGDLSIAADRLRDALSAFEEALRGDGSDIDAAADALLSGMRDFLGDLAGSAAGTDETAPGVEGSAEVLGAETIARMIEEMRALAAAGDRAGARRLLEALRDLVENARMAPTLSAEDRARLEAMERSARDLEDLARAQRETLNETGRQTLLNRQRQRQGLAPRDFDELEAQQADLARRLSALKSGLAQSGIPQPEGLGEAEGGMTRAETALARESGEIAIGNQLEALRNLESAAESMRRRLEDALAKLPGGASGTDPLGRPLPGLLTRGYELPDHSERRAVEAILERLREKLSDPDIDEVERDYIRRLLRRF